MSKFTATAAASALLVLSTVALTGCNAINALAYKYTDESYADASALGDDLGAESAWIPDDAHDIQVRRSTVEDAEEIVVTLVSSTPLDPTACRDVERLSAPAWTLDGTPDVYGLDTVTACGEWSVVPTDDGWLAWTPNAVGERQSADRG